MLVLSVKRDTHRFAFGLCEKTIPLWLLVLAFVTYEATKDLTESMVNIHCPTLLTFRIATTIEEHCWRERSMSRSDVLVMSTYVDQSFALPVVFLVLSP